MTQAESDLLMKAFGAALELRTRLDRAEAERDALKAENERLWNMLSVPGTPEVEP